MDYYVLRVATGKELRVRDALQAHGYDTRVPCEIALLRRRGEWHDELRTLFPGYVFIGLEGVTPQVWHRVVTACIFVCGNVRWLGDPTPITAEEAKRLSFLAPDNNPLQPTHVTFDANGWPHFSAGPLEQLADNHEVQVNARQRRATVDMVMCGEAKQITLSIITDEVAHD